VLLLLKPGSSGGRWFIVQRTAEMIKDNPGGIGFGQFAVQYGERQAAYFKQHGTDGKEALLADNVQFALNEYLQVTTEGGIAMGLAMLAITVMVIVAGIRLYRRRGGRWVLAPLTGFVALSICCLSFYMLHHWWALLLYGCCAVAILLSLWLPKYKVLWPGAVLLAIGMAVVGHHTYQSAKSAQGLAMASRLSAAGYRVYADSAFKTIDAAHVPVVVYSLAWASHCQRYGDAKAAIVHLEKAATCQTHSDICQLLGSAYLQVGDTAKAIAQFEKATYMVPKLFVPRKQLADIYHSLHNREREKYWLESIVRMPMKIPHATSEGIVLEARERLGLYGL
jgi:hypothetical protein